MIGKRHAIILGLVACLAATGCFPGSDEGSNLTMRLALGGLGISPDGGDINAWTGYLGRLEQGLEGVFELGLDNQDFFLGLHLTCQEANVSIQGLGTFAQLVSGDNGDVLQMSLNVQTCTQGVFQLAIFWDEDGVVSTFTGTSDPRELPPADQQAVDLDAYQHPVGKVSCSYDTSGKQGQLTFSAVDSQENVRFTRKNMSATGGEVGFTLDNVPVGRPVDLYVTDESGAEVRLGFSSVIVTYAGETLELLSSDCQPQF
jgi:hypothetical protein